MQQRICVVSAPHAFLEFTNSQLPNNISVRYENLRFRFQNPQNKSVAKSFRYMRRKPTIIAFKTPSSDSLDVVEEARTPKSESRETKMEEGRFEAVAMTEGDAVQYPVGKPLEVSDGADE